MDENADFPGRSVRAGALMKWLIAIAFLHLVFAAGVFFGDRILSTGADTSFADALRSPENETSLLKNSVGIPLRRNASGAWIAESPVTANQFKKLTGSTPLTGPQTTTDRPVGDVTHAEASAFCRILTDAEHAAGLLPKSHRYRLPLPGERSPESQGSDEWIQSDSPNPAPLFAAIAQVEVDTPLYAPDAETVPGGWPRWHANLIAGPAGALQLPKGSAPRIEVLGSPDGTRRRLTIRAWDPDPEDAANLANAAASLIQNECNSLAKRRRETEFGYLRAEMDSAESRNAKERTALLDLMAEYDIADTLDLPSWFIARENLSDDLGIQNAKNNIARLQELQKHLASSKEEALPDLTPNPGLSDAASAYLRLYAERKLLKVEEAQLVKAGASDTDQNLVAHRAKISRNHEALGVARKSLTEDVSRELKVAENLLVDLELVKRQRAKENPPTVPTSEQPRDEAVLESRIAFVDDRLEQLRTLRGDALYEYALVISDHENPLRALAPEYIKHRELGKKLRLAIADLERETETLTKTPIGPEPPEDPEAKAPAGDAGATGDAEEDEEAAAKANAEREAAEQEAAERLAKLKEEREQKLEEMGTARSQKMEQLAKAEADKKIAEEAVNKEIGILVKSLTDSRERDRRELDYLIAKRKYLVGWHRLVGFRADFAVKKTALESPPKAAEIVVEATAEDAVSDGAGAFVYFGRGTRPIAARPHYRNPDLHFRVVLEKVKK